MAIYQIFVKLLDGTTRCIQIPTPSIPTETLKLRLSSITGVPPQSQRLVTGTRDVSSQNLISAPAGTLTLPSLTLLLRLPGGKGGFGSLLRGAATKAGQKKTNNFDACRDMSGRRLRHVNAEKKLEEWQAEAEDRRLEKLAEQFLRKKAKEARKSAVSPDVEKYVQKYRDDAAKCMVEMDESVREAFALYESGKRKALPSSGPSKRLKIWLGKKKMDDESESESEDSEDDEDSDDDEREDGDEKSVVLDGGNSGLVSCAQSDGESSGGGSSQSVVEEANGDSDASASPKGSSDLGASVESEMDMPHDEIVTQGVVGLDMPQDEIVTQGVAGPNPEKSNDVDEPNVAEEGSIHGVTVAPPSSILDSDMSNSVSEKIVKPELVPQEPVTQSITVSKVEEPLNFDMLNSAADLEVLGMDRLKTELQARGLKCGGTLQERAARLFLLKTTPLEKLPKKLLAKPAAGGK